MEGTSDAVALVFRRGETGGGVSSRVGNHLGSGVDTLKREFVRGRFPAFSGSTVVTGGARAERVGIACSSRAIALDKS